MGKSGVSGFGFSSFVGVSGEDDEQKKWTPGCCELEILARLEKKLCFNTWGFDAVIKDILLMFWKIRM